jgi:hypothetical protein
MFVESTTPIAVVGKQGRLKGIVVRGALIAGLTTGTEESWESDGNSDGSSDDEGAIGREAVSTNYAAQEFGEEGRRV